MIENTADAKLNMAVAIVADCETVNDSKSMNLTSNDIECVWAIVRQRRPFLSFVVSCALVASVISIPFIVDTVHSIGKAIGFVFICRFRLHCLHFTFRVALVAYHLVLLAVNKVFGHTHLQKITFSVIFNILSHI